MFYFLLHSYKRKKLDRSIYRPHISLQQRFLYLACILLCFVTDYSVSQVKGFNLQLSGFCFALCFFFPFIFLFSGIFNAFYSIHSIQALSWLHKLPSGPYFIPYSNQELYLVGWGLWDASLGWKFIQFCHSSQNLNRCFGHLSPWGLETNHWLKQESASEDLHSHVAFGFGFGPVPSVTIRMW